jgi:hypothetical protein
VIPGQRENVPPRALPVVYFLVGHLALAFALIVPALDPRSVSGFFFSPRMFAVVHLVTLGWITTSIFGALYIVAPLALRMPMKTNWLDWTVCVLTIGGAAGVIAHFWISGYSGVAWSGKVLLVAFCMMAWRVLGALKRGRSPRAVKAHIGLGIVNLILAATLGTLLALNRQKTILPGNHITNVFAHAHGAIVGWATVIVFGVGYRLLPMFLPAGQPKSRWIWGSALLLEVGVSGLFVGFMFHHPLVRPFAVVTAAGVGVFLLFVVAMIRDPKPGAKKLIRPDLGMLHAMQALFYLLLATIIGLALVFSSHWHVEWGKVYGVFVLLGFLGQIIIGIGMRLMPMFSFLGSWSGADFKVLPKNPHQMPVRPLQYLTLAFWTVGVPVFAYGLGWDAFGWLVAGAWTLLAGTVCAGVNTVRVLSFARSARET